MSKLFLKYSLALGLLVATQACLLQSQAVPVALDPNGIHTAIAGTLAAASSQTAQGILPLEPTLSATATRFPSATPFPTYTLVVGAGNIFVTVNTNCRSGPGKAYPVVNAVEVGQAVQVVGRSADSQYWIIRDPDDPRKFCWLWGKYVTMTGIVSGLQVMTPPPKPTPKPTRTPTRRPPATAAPASTDIPTLEFSLAYGGLDNCAPTEWWPEVLLTNNSGLTAQSIALIMLDGSPPPTPTSGQMYTLVSEDFTNRTGCVDIQTVDSLPSGATYSLSLPALAYDPTGFPMSLAISLCSEPGQLGTCGIEFLDFTP
jgi:hypothetical protein